MITAINQDHALSAAVMRLVDAGYCVNLVTHCERCGQRMPVFHTHLEGGHQ